MGASAMVQSYFMHLRHGARLNTIYQPPPSNLNNTLGISVLEAPLYSRSKVKRLAEADTGIKSRQSSVVPTQVSFPPS